MQRQEYDINISREIFQAWLRNQEFVRVLEEADAPRLLPRGIKRHLKVWKWSL